MKESLFARSGNLNLPWLEIIVPDEPLAKLGCGKSTTMYIKAQELMTPEAVARIQALQRAWAQQHNLTLPKMSCPVYHVLDAEGVCDYSFTSNDHGFDPRTTTEILFEELRIPSGKVRKYDRRLVKHSLICIQDLTQHADGRESMTDSGIKSGQRRVLQMARKNDIHILADTQDIATIDKRWRDACDCIRVILKFTHTPYTYRTRATTVVETLVFNNIIDYEYYRTTRDTSRGRFETLTHRGNIYGMVNRNGEVEKSCFNSNSGEEFFLRGEPGAWTFANGTLRTKGLEYIHKIKQEIRDMDVVDKVDKKKVAS